ncbi:prolipoprotein diacylglyceryl transferase [Tepidibacillus fermentans]|uniref:Phosphatidylglycerol--prolipoprotein diacylglyceryl transferase n=1 Tax=Tepidibacillus fermentans TaxID=1281767 RepID=A0A4R3KGL8_9BACI|nr:prolipoprotein diacylglyceryl transferase [Tepidibacillus fermentans]TCS81811.1 prolipoprotein diacylglyceryl transferase [Tepidibacillus fermentans]
MVTGYIDPIAFQLGPIQVHWYGVILGSAAIVGLLLALWETKRIGFDSDLLMDLLIYAVPAAIIGARAYYVLFQWDYYSKHPSEIIAIWHGGLAIHGALIGSVLTAYVFSKKKGVRFWKLADLAAPSILLGQAIGRWGNFMNQEAHGGPVSLEFLQNMHLPQWIINQMNINGVYYHPTFLYESLWDFIGVFLLLWLRKKNPIQGMVFLSYFIWYSVGRFYIEGLRTDSLAFNGPSWLSSLMNILWSPMRLFFEPGNMEYGNVRIAQFIGVVLILAALILMWYRKYKVDHPLHYED